MSCVPPQIYANRFSMFMSEIITYQENDSRASTGSIIYNNYH